MKILNTYKEKSDKAYRNFCQMRRNAEKAYDNGNFDQVSEYLASADKYAKDVSYFERLIADEAAK